MTTAPDLYALGAILYELLTGLPPFAGQSVAEILRQKTSRLPRPPREIRADMPADLEIICLKCLETDPADRYASAGDLAADLQNWLEGRAIRAHPVSAPVLLWQWLRRNPLAASLLALVLLLVVGAAVGSTMAAIRVSREKNRAVAAEAAVREQLWRACLAQARAARRVVLAGHRFEGLAALAKAAKIRVAPELRSEAAMALAAADLQVRRKWPVRSTTDALPLVFSPDLHWFLRARRGGGLERIASETGAVERFFPVRLIR